MDLNIDFNITTLHLAPDYEGEVVATLVAANENAGRKKAVLYLHGFIDYFFQTHLAEQFLKNQFDFYALDLRKYGRSLLPHQHPNYCRSISEYFEEISTALRIIYGDSQTEITLLGHSTGGLIACSYVNEGKERSLVKNVVLNSPFFDFFISEPFKTIGLIGAKISARFSAFAQLSKGIPPAYNGSLHKNYHGEWNFDLNWKPIKGFPAYSMWVLAIRDAQQKLLRSQMEVPVLVLHAKQSLKAMRFSDLVFRTQQSPETMRFSEKVFSSDIVLNVEDMKTIGPQIGRNVTLVEIPNGIHDLFLSKKPVRENAFKAVFQWLRVST